MKFIRTMAALACTVLLAGCLPVLSRAPVGTTTGLGADKALIGTWKGHGVEDKDHKDAYFHFLLAPDGSLTIAMIFARGTSDDGWTIFKAHTAALGRNTFINAVETFDKGAPTSDRLKDNNIPLLYTIKGRTLTVYLLDEDLTKAAIKAGKLKGTVEGGDMGDVTLTSDPAELDAFMAKPEAAALFKPLLVLKRVE